MISNNKISQIQGLESLSNLTKLSLNYNLIKKIEQLDNLTSLVKLNMDNN